LELTDIVTRIVDAYRANQNGALYNAILDAEIALGRAVADVPESKCEDGGNHEPVRNEHGDVWCSKCCERLLGHLPNIAESGRDMEPIGTVVTPISPHGAEIIVGLIANHEADEYFVIWLSNQRGLFVCWEAPADVVAAKLDQAGMSDSILDTLRAARRLAALDEEGEGR
jgi:hypothetical protein